MVLVLIGPVGLWAVGGLRAITDLAADGPSAVAAQSGSTVGFAQSAYVADEVTPPGVPRSVQVARTGNTIGSGAVSVVVRVRGGTATLGADFTLAADPGVDHTVLEWAAGDSATKTCEYRIIDDGVAETGEEIQFELTEPHGVDLSPGASQTRTWIYDDDFAQAPVLKKAGSHDILYYISLPKDWEHGDDAPVVFSIDGAGGWYRGMEETYRAARGDHPFILVTPITRSNGAPWPALAEYYPTDRGDGEERFVFDETGLLAIWDDLRSAGVTSDSRFYIAGHSGGGLLAYRMVFQHPDLLFAAAPTCPNFWASAISRVSSDPARETLPVTVFQGLSDPYLQGHMEPQWQLARRWLTDNGFRNAAREMVPGGHEPFADLVLALFAKNLSDRASGGGRCYLPFGRR